MKDKTFKLPLILDTKFKILGSGFAEYEIVLGHQAVGEGWKHKKLVSVSDLT